MEKIRVGDTVIVMSGASKGTQGEVLRRIKNKKTGKTAWLIVKDVNMQMKHMKPNPQANQPGGIIKKEGKIDISNVSLLNRAKKKGDRVGFKILDDGRKVRYFKSDGEIIDI